MRKTSRFPAVCCRGRSAEGFSDYTPLTIVRRIPLNQTTTWLTEKRRGQEIVKWVPGG